MALHQKIERAARNLPGGMRDGVCAHLMAREMDLGPRLSPAGRDIAHAFQNATRGIPMDEEQRERWLRLGLIDAEDC